MQSVNTILATVNFAICPNCNEQIGECITCSDCGETSFIPDYVEIETTWYVFLLIGCSIRIRLNVMSNEKLLLNLNKK